MANSILLDFPDCFETERLIVRCPQPGDGAALNAAIVESLDELRPWMPWAQAAPAPEESEEYCRRARARFLAREDLPLQIFLKDGTFVGGSGLHRIDWDVPKFEIGYWCRASRQGQGYVTEAVIGLKRFAFEQLGAQRVEIRCDARNLKSQAVAERAGFHFEACLRREARDHRGELRDTLIFVLLRDDWTNL